MDLKHFILTGCALAGAALLLAACSGSGTAGPGPQDQLQLALPPLPVDKLPAELSADIIEGNDTFSAALNAVAVDTDLELNSTGNATCWGIWRLQPGADELQSVQIQLSTSGNDEAWAAIANYDLGRWEFAGPLTASEEFPLNNVAHRSGAGNCFIAVITAGGNSATVNRLVMTEDRVGWQIVTVDHDSFVGKMASLAVVDGNPAVCYYDDSGAQALKFIRSATATGADPEDWGAPTTIATGWIAYTDIEEVAGTPAVCFWLSATLRYARSLTVTGADPGDWVIVGVDGADNAGHYCSLEVVDGNPAISYNNNPDVAVANLRYARSTTPTGDSIGDWTQKVEVDTGGEIGRFSSLAVVDGAPAISYYDVTNKHLKYARATTASGAALEDWTQFVELDTVLFGGVYTSLAVIDGNPAIAYWDTQNSDLKYVRSTTATGEQQLDWSAPIVVDAGIQPIGSDNFISLLEYEGAPVVSYPVGEFTSHLGLARSSTSTGDDSADWADKELVDTDGSVGQFCDMAIVGGRLAIAYFDASNNDLKYAIEFQ